MTWHRIDDPENQAPKDGTIIEVRAGGLEFPAHFDFVCWESDSGGIEDGEEDAPLYAWCATTDDHPDDWDDGICWGVNGDGLPSSKPTEWRRLTIPNPPEKERT